MEIFCIYLSVTKPQGLWGRSSLWKKNTLSNDFIMINMPFINRPRDSLWPAGPYLCFGFLVHFRFSVGCCLVAKSTRGVICTHKSSLKAISKSKTSIFTFLWPTSGLGKILFLGTETPRVEYLNTFAERNNLTSMKAYQKQ